MTPLLLKPKGEAQPEAPFQSLEAKYQDKLGPWDIIEPKDERSGNGRYDPYTPYEIQLGVQLPGTEKGASAKYIYYLGDDQRPYLLDESGQAVPFREELTMPGDPNSGRIFKLKMGSGQKSDVRKSGSQVHNGHCTLTLYPANQNHKAVLCVDTEMPQAYPDGFNGLYVRPVPLDMAQELYNSGSPK